MSKSTIMLGACNGYYYISYKQKMDVDSCFNCILNENIVLLITYRSFSPSSSYFSVPKGNLRQPLWKL